jgi:hypothetical protein
MPFPHTFGTQLPSNSIKKRHKHAIAGTKCSPRVLQREDKWIPRYTVEEQRAIGAARQIRYNDTASLH